MSVVFPRQTLTEDANPLPAGNLLSGMFGEDQGAIEPKTDDNDNNKDNDDDNKDADADNDDDG